MPGMLETFTHETFVPLIGQKFKVTAAEQSVEFELVDVVEWPTPRGRSHRPDAQPPRRASFSLFFTGETLLPQAMYPMQHDAFGSQPLDIFIVPVGPCEAGGYEYEAVFT